MGNKAKTTTIHNSDTKNVCYFSRSVWNWIHWNIRIWNRSLHISNVLLIPLPPPGHLHPLGRVSDLSLSSHRPKVYNNYLHFSSSKTQHTQTNFISSALNGCWTRSHQSKKISLAMIHKHMFALFHVVFAGLISGADKVSFHFFSSLHFFGWMFHFILVGIFFWYKTCLIYSI